MATPSSPPEIVIIAGPNGAGKSTTAPDLIKDSLHITEFVNADTIARGLSEFSPESVAFEAGRLMLTRIRRLANARASFAFETTLATRAFAPMCRRWADRGYGLCLLFLWLPSPEAAVARVARRVKMGGHAVPPEVVKRRYRRGLANLFELYLPLATTWRVYNTGGDDGPKLIASSSEVADAELWTHIQGTAGRR
ncbi:MAG: zeta toxin family protein [Phycisphaerales bacterium]|nr:zeta toxin family protein [Phycisphaerales bacterium]